MRPRPRLPSFSAALTTIFWSVVIAATPAHAEYGGRLYHIERPRLAIDLSYRTESEERQGPFIDVQNDTRTVNERFDIETGGWVYHPALMTYTLMLSPEWEQSLDEPDSGSSRSSDAFLLGYSLDMHFLESKPYSVDVFARKQRSTLTTSLATTSETESDTYGATLRLKYSLLPTSLALVHADSEQTGFFTSQETRDEARLNMRHTRSSNDTTFNANWQTSERTTLGTTAPATTTSTENLFGSLYNVYRVTPDQRILLNSNLTFRQTESDVLSPSALSDFNSSGVFLSETLNWRHSKTFSTYYNLVHSQDETDTTSVDRTSASAGLTHSLYENLTTGASVSASTSSAGEDDYGGNLNLGYQRKIPGGMIYASLGQDYRVTQRSVGEEFVQVIDESHQLTTGAVTVLGNRYVDLASIVVTSADHSIVYAEDVDYTLEVIDSSVRISRTTFGLIAEGDSVLVNYSYLSNPAFDSSTYGQSYGIGFYLWSAWRINYRYAHSQQDFISGTPPDVLAESTRHTLDTDLTWKWSTTRFLYEDTDSTTGVSVSRWRLDENLIFQPRRNAFLSLSGHVGQTTLKEQNTEENFFGFRSDLQWRVTNWSRAKIEGFYDEVDGATNKTSNTGAEARWEWFYRIWRGDATYRFINEEDRISGQTRDRHSLFLSVKRLLY